MARLASQARDRGACLHARCEGHYGTGVVGKERTGGHLPKPCHITASKKEDRILDIGECCIPPKKLDQV
jgi:hypothetical protein